jgi:DNA-binding LacI/PurR family transcriptional regulator
MTINEIAKAANVSTATVSRVVNGKGNVKESTRIRVQKIIDKHGYEPSQSAIGLSKQVSNYVPIFIEEFNGYNCEFLDIACNIIQSANYFPLMFKTVNKTILNKNVKKLSQVRPALVVLLGVAETKVNLGDKTKVVVIDLDDAPDNQALRIRTAIKELQKK